MPLLIATDEAGYGPKLGPLVICASVWRYPADCLPRAFDPLKETCIHCQAGKVRIDDSKKIFIAGKQRNGSLATVPDVILRAAAGWACQPHPLRETKRWLETIVPLDWVSVNAAPWLFARVDSEVVDHPQADQSLVSHWSSQGAQYLGCLVRLITPAAFNEAIHRGMNKADLLTEATCELVMSVLMQWQNDEGPMTVISDRHGGRAYYAAPLQQVFTDGLPVVISENKQDSRYQLRHTIEGCRDVELDWSFRVGGDSFAPVGLSSIIAKWIREYSMAGFNQFIASHLPADKIVRPQQVILKMPRVFVQDVKDAGLGQLFKTHSFERLR